MEASAQDGELHILAPKPRELRGKRIQVRPGHRHPAPALTRDGQQWQLGRRAAGEGARHLLVHALRLSSGMLVGDALPHASACGVLITLQTPAQARGVRTLMRKANVIPLTATAHPARPTPLLRSIAGEPSGQSAPAQWPAREPTPAATLRPAPSLPVARAGDGAEARALPNEIRGRAATEAISRRINDRPQAPD